MKLNYSFSKREIIMILVLILALVGLLYYRFVYLGISNQVEQYNTQDLESQIQLEQLQLIQWQKMQDEIKGGTIATSTLKTYDNQKTEINFLNGLFDSVIRYNFSFERPVATGDTVRRNVSVTFTTIDYASALTIIARLYDSDDRVLIKDIKISPGDLTSSYLAALAEQALKDPVALAQLKKQVRSLIESGLSVDSFVMKVYNGEPITEATEDSSQAGTDAAQAGETQDNVPQETLLDIEALQDGEQDTAGAIMLEGGTVETLADGTIVAPQAQGTEALLQSESETETETEEPVQTLQNSIVNVSLTMTFYETAYGAPSLDGLIIQTPETTAPEATS